MAFICLLFFVLSFAISSAAPTFQEDIPNLVHKTVENKNPNTALSSFLLKKPSRDPVWHFKKEAVDRQVRKAVVGWEKTAVDRQVRSATLDPAAAAIERQAKKTALDQKGWKATGAALFSSPSSHSLRPKARQTDNSIISALEFHSANPKLKNISRSFDLLVSSRQGGLTGDVCSSSADCAVSRDCVDDIANASRCVPSNGLEACSSNNDCVTGEWCTTTDDGTSFCISTAAFPPPDPNPPTTNPPTTNPPTSATEGGDGLTGDICSSSADCAVSRECVDDIANASRCVPSNGLEACSSNNDCVTGEWCTTTDDGTSFCISTAAFPPPDPNPPTTNPPTTNPPTTNPPTTNPPTTNPPNTNPPGANPPGTNPPGANPPGTNPPGTNPPGTNPGTGIPGPPSPGGPATQDGSSSEPCIGVDSLVHFSRKQLVFERDILANVLCDESKSCATPGHMVSYHGKGMMMKSYCEMVGRCERKVMYVNSPRYVRGVTVPSKSENMVFTAFSARYATRAEEGMLSFAIRLGL